MFAWDYDAVIFDNDVYCTGCLPDGICLDDIDEYGNSVCQPIFEGSEWDSAPYCCECGEPVESVTWIDPVMRKWQYIEKRCTDKGYDACAIQAAKIDDILTLTGCYEHTQMYKLAYYRNELCEESISDIATNARYCTACYPPDDDDRRRCGTCAFGKNGGSEAFHEFLNELDIAIYGCYGNEV